MKQPEPSSILIVLVEGDSHLWPGLEVEELLFVGESAGLESEAGTLEDAIAPLIPVTKPGRYYLYGFTAHYHKDYWGEVDVDYEMEGWREATPDDEKQFFISDEDGFRVEAATQIGFVVTDGSPSAFADGKYTCTEAQLIAFAKACERKGLSDAAKMTRKVAASFCRLHPLEDALAREVEAIAATFDEAIAILDGELTPILEAECVKAVAAASESTNVAR